MNDLELNYEQWKELHEKGYVVVEKKWKDNETFKVVVILEKDGKSTTTFEMAEHNHCYFGKVVGI